MRTERGLRAASSLADGEKCPKRSNVAPLVCPILDGIMSKKLTKKGIGSVEAKVELTVHAPCQRVWDALVH